MLKPHAQAVIIYHLEQVWLIGEADQKAQSVVLMIL